MHNCFIIVTSYTLTNDFSKVCADFVVAAFGLILSFLLQKQFGSGIFIAAFVLAILVLLFGPSLCCKPDAISLSCSRSLQKPVCMPWSTFLCDKYKIVHDVMP